MAWPAPRTRPTGPHSRHAGAEVLGTGGLTWITGLGEDVIAFEYRDVVVVANLGSDPAPLPDGLVVIAASTTVIDTTTIPGDTTLWAKRS